MADAKAHTGWAWDAAGDGTGQCWEKTGSSLVGDNENCHASKVLKHQHPRLWNRGSGVDRIEYVITICVNVDLFSRSSRPAHDVIYMDACLP